MWILFRAPAGEQTPRAMLNTAVNEVGAYLRCSRALAVFGASGRPPEMAAEFCAAGMRATPASQVLALLGQMEKAHADELGGLTLQASTHRRYPLEEVACHTLGRMARVSASDVADAKTEGWDEERLAGLVTRDSMIGTGLARDPMSAP